VELNENIAQQIERYLREDLDDRELESFQELLRNDKNLNELVLKYKEIYDTMDETSWNLTKFDPENEKAQHLLEFFKDEKNKKYLRELENIIVEQKSSKMNIRAIFGTAAVAAVLVLAIFFMRNNKTVDYGQLYDQYASLDELPSFTERGITDSVMSLIETQFYAKNFKSVNTVVEDNEEDFDEDQKSLVYIYQGVSYGERGMYQQAYDALSSTELYDNSIYSQMADWYLGLAMMRGESIAKAKEIFTLIAKDDGHYKQADAKQILKKL